MKVAVIGATGTAGSRTVAKLKDQGASVVELSRSVGVDLITGEGLPDALDGAHAVVDTSNAFPSDETVDLQDALTSATRHVVDACASQRVAHLVFLSISGVEDSVFDNFPYYLAKRVQEKIVAAGPVPATIVKSTQWHEFATNPAAVQFGDDEVVVEDWLIQPVAADTVAEVLSEVALNVPRATAKYITGPEVVRLPDLTGKLLHRIGDSRPVRAAPPELAALSEGALLAPDGADELGPTIDVWLQGVDPGH